MKTSICLLAGLILLTAVGVAAEKAPSTMRDLTFLTRDGCMNTPVMRQHLNDALAALHWPKDYQTVDIGQLKASDPRRGYPTPTLLWKGKDLFGMPEPKPPFPEPT